MPVDQKTSLLEGYMAKKQMARKLDGQNTRSLEMQTMDGQIARRVDGQKARGQYQTPL